MAVPAYLEGKLLEVAELIQEKEMADGRLCMEPPAVAKELTTERWQISALIADLHRGAVTFVPHVRPVPHVPGLREIGTFGGNATSKLERAYRKTPPVFVDSLLPQPDAPLPPNLWSLLQGKHLRDKKEFLDMSYKIYASDVRRLTESEVTGHLASRTGKALRLLFRPKVLVNAQCTESYTTRENFGPFGPAIAENLGLPINEHGEVSGIAIKDIRRYAVAEPRAELEPLVSAADGNAVKLSSEELIALGEREIKGWERRFGWYRVTTTTMDKLRDAEVPRCALMAITRLREREYLDRAAFARDVRRVLPPEALEFEGQIVTACFDDTYQHSSATLPVSDHGLFVNAAYAVHFLRSWGHAPTRAFRALMRYSPW